MTATNHALTGAVIGLGIGNAWLALPSALVSHFVLDSLPHFGFSKLNDRGQQFSAMLVADITLCFILVVGLFVSGTENWLLAAIAAFTATSPDFMWAPDYFRHKLHGKVENHRSSIIKRFHAQIQWYQKPPGAAVEVLYFVMAMALLANLI